MDPRTIVWKRVIDMNDRSLRNIIIGIGGKANGVMRQDGFNITAASEIMAILCLSNSLSNLKEKQRGVPHKPSQLYKFNEENYQLLTQNGYDNFGF